VAHKSRGFARLLVIRWWLLSLLTCWLVASDLHAADYRVLPEQSVFAVVTHKGGFAAGAAHNHVVVASRYETRFWIEESKPLSARFQMELATEDLVVDDPAHRQKWYPRFEALAILDEPFKEMSEKDRAKIRETMLSKKQLEASAFPEITARVEEVVAKSSTLGNVELPYRVMLRLNVHGREVVEPVAARYERDGEKVLIEAVGIFRFEDFGIKPYSAMLGAVKNKNEFHIYVTVVAVPVEK